MAELLEIDRAYIHKLFMSEESKLRETMSVSKSELRAAIDATDIWIEDNQASWFSCNFPSSQSSSYACVTVVPPTEITENALSGAPFVI